MSPTSSTQKTSLQCGSVKRFPVMGITQRQISTGYLSQQNNKGSLSSMKDCHVNDALQYKPRRKSLIHKKPLRPIQTSLNSEAVEQQKELRRNSIVTNPYQRHKIDAGSTTFRNFVRHIDIRTNLRPVIHVFYHYRC